MQSAAYRIGHFHSNLRDHLAVGACLLLSSCFGGSDDVQIAEVTGTVILDGNPAVGTVITFQSDSGFGASADVSDDGTFSMTSQYGEGLPLGDYRVAVMTVIPPEADPAGGASNDAVSKILQKANVPKRYQETSTSGLTAEIMEGTNELTFDLMRE